MLYYLGLLGMAAFSITGVIAAGKKDMDLFSIVLLGVVTAIGGGTLRDIILDTSPVFWIGDLSYLWVSLVASVIAFFCVGIITRLYPLFLYLDAFGLALFTIVAAENTLNLGFSNTIAVAMGLITGITGGMLRDVLTGKMPLLLCKEFYATPALVGAICFVSLQHIFPAHDYIKLYCVAIIFVLRFLAIHYGLYYPSWLRYRGDGNGDS